MVREALAASNPSEAHNRSFAVALSGGADSAMLAVYAAHLAEHSGQTLHCFHIHHGLQALADPWQAHVHRLAAILGVSCHSLRVQVDLGQGDGMESAARAARYEGLAKLAKQTGVNRVWLAHHGEDQAETVLLRLLRGAGPLGLSAMAPTSIRDGITYTRPWLDMPRARILAAAQAFTQATGWMPVQDPTNLDPAYTRAALRRQLTPILNERWRGWQGVLARHARQSREMMGLVAEIAAEDWQKLDPAADGLSFSLAAWRTLSHARQAQVLRYWLSGQGLRAPTDARLSELMRQMRGLHALGHDRQMKLHHERAWIVCVRGRIMLIPKKQ
ncbi:tRNA lysidine(34) synthetase TilS [Alcaligenaceae bacterium CGII-47]|nr:tRNA lysidine(34) synthetase TilS [Alcaligenaceae bacterium CGII-47]